MILLIISVFNKPGLEAWSAFVGTTLPLLIAIIQQSRWSSRVRAIVAVICCIAAAVATAWIQGDLSWERTLDSLLIIYTLAQVTYHSLWNPIGAAPALQRATDAASPRDQAY